MSNALNPAQQPAPLINTAALVERAIIEYRRAEAAHRAAVTEGSRRHLDAANQNSARAMSALRRHDPNLAAKLEQEATAAMALVVALTCDDTDDSDLQRAYKDYGKHHVDDAAA